MEDDEKQMANEPEMVYYTKQHSMDYMASIPDGLMDQIVDYTIRACDENQTISHDEIEGMVKAHMGWK